MLLRKSWGRWNVFTVFIEKIYSKWTHKVQTHGVQGEAMVFSRLGVLNSFLTYDIFNLQWVYQDVTPLYEGLSPKYPAMHYEK